MSLKLLLYLGCFVLSFQRVSLEAQTRMLDWKVDSLIIDTAFASGVFDLADTLYFSNQTHGMSDNYDASFRSHGLQFRNGVSTTLLAPLLVIPEIDPMGDDYSRAFHASPVLGAEGEETELYLRSSVFKGDNRYSKTHITLYDQGKIIVGEQANVDLVFPRWGNYTRQWWVQGDGTGRLEFEEGFVADRSQMGTVDEGFGSLRLNAAHVMTHHTQSLPAYYMHDDQPSDFVGINGHLVFEENPGSRWTVATHDQTYFGGIQAFVDFVIETRTNLNLAGQQVHWVNKGYTNNGGLDFKQEGVTMTKKGLGTLIISGDQYYKPGSFIDLQEGRLALQSNPYIAGFSSEPNLSVCVQQGAELSLEADAIEVSMIRLLDEQSEMHTSLATTLLTDTLFANGILYVKSYNTEDLKAGASFSLIHGFVYGEFASLSLPSLEYGLFWHIDSLYDHGIIRIDEVSSVSVVADQKNDLFHIYPNPSVNYITVDGVSADLYIVNALGELIFYKQANRSANCHSSFKIDVSGFASGVYLICSQDRCIQFVR